MNPNRKPNRKPNHEIHNKHIRSGQGPHISRLQFDVKNTFDNTPELQGHEFKIVTDELNFLNEVEVEIEGEKYGETIQTKAAHWLSKEIAAVVANCEDVEFNKMDFEPSV